MMVMLPSLCIRTVNRTKERNDLQKTKYITIISNKKEVVLNVSSILYILMKRNNAEIHVSGDKIYDTRITLTELSEKLGDGFIMIHRSALVSAKAIHNIGERVYLNNGETLDYAVRKKKEIIRNFREKQKDIIEGFAGENNPKSEEEYHSYYRSFDYMPFAFSDIEMIFDEERHAVDWIFRYGNPALAKLEKVPLEKLIGHSFGSIFANMDSKWLRSYESATLYGEKREIISYSPEIGTYLKVICFPTFPGHCGCILFDIAEIEFTRDTDDAEKALMLYYGQRNGRDL